MKAKTKVGLIIAATFVVIGSIIFVGVMFVFNWDFTKLSASKYENNNYEINENYKNISIISNTADITLVPTENKGAVVSCYEQKNLKHTVTVNDGTLEIKVVDTRKWYEYIGVNFSTPKITVNIPKGEYGILSVKSNTGNVEISKDFKFKNIDILQTTGNVINHASALENIKIKTSTGSILAENLSALSLDLSVSTGEVTVSDVSCEGEVKVGVSTGKANLTNIACKSVTSSGSTGDISLNKVIAKEKLFIERSTGDVNLNGSDAAELYIKTSTGDVSGSLLSGKVFITKSSTGSVNVPKTVDGGKREISTSTGDIKITVE